MHSTDLRHTSETTHSQSTSSSLYSEDSTDRDVLDLPPRPPTRLSFHRDVVMQIRDSSKREGSFSDHKTHPTALESTRCDLDFEDMSFCNSSDSSEQEDDSSGDDSDDEDSSSEDEFVFDSFFSPKPVIPPSTPTASSSAAPTPAARPPSPTPSTSTSPACPSPLSPRRTHCHGSKQSTSVHPRHNYPHHGFSRSALMHQKWFWNNRYEEHAGWQLCSATGSAAYDGISIAPTRPPSRDRRSSLSVFFTSTSGGKMGGTATKGSDPKSPIYPRMGDIGALREQYSADVDRWYCGFPLFKIRRRLYLHDMEHRSPFRSKSKGKSKARTPPTRRGSETTAVDSGTEEDEEGVGSSEEEQTLVDEEESFEFDFSVVGETLTNERAPSACGGRGNEELRPWETNWFFRWEKFAELLKEDAAAASASASSTRVNSPYPILTQSSPKQQRRQISSSESEEGDEPPSPKFYFEEADEDESYYQYEDDEDYGVLVSNPVFGRALSAGYGSYAYEFLPVSDSPKRESS
ncbi:hypothetical protein JAAARDRAFT_34141 [Jaapia argillacea MUCL 33604]|uniref:Uncharacterized protein n=1 Tax=Jaapia argillacea MUCL 33604 TaxID=933084 RepID=A0A067Q6X3_9AGAM|nr:hypothetical protein JAAARDRAFT_34141 [Jaapia argillacea MUCL 33604]